MKKEEKGRRKKEEGKRKKEERWRRRERRNPIKIYPRNIIHSGAWVS